MLDELKRLMGEAWKSEDHARELNAAAVNALPRLIAVCEAARDARDVWYATDRERPIDAPEREEMYALCRALDAMKEVPRG